MSKRNFALEPFDTSTRSVSCPRGLKPVSGGLAINQQSGTLLQASHPTTRGWKIQLRNTSSGERLGNVAAMCSSRPGLSVRTKQRTPAQSATEVQVNARCPRGSKAIGGGGQLTGAGSAIMQGSFPAGDGRTWGIRWVLPGSRRVPLKAYAICDKRVRNYEIVTETAEITGRLRGSHGTEAAVASCAGKGKLVGGGFFRRAEDTHWHKIGPTDAGWEATAYGIRGTVVANAVCGKFQRRN